MRSVLVLQDVGPFLPAAPPLPLPSSPYTPLHRHLLLVSSTSIRKPITLTHTHTLARAWRLNGFARKHSLFTMPTPYPHSLSSLLQTQNGSHHPSKQERHVLSVQLGWRTRTVTVHIIQAEKERNIMPNLTGFPTLRISII